MSVARSSSRAAISVARRVRIRALSFAVRAFQAGSARSAASIARRVSDAPRRGTSTIVSPVAGFTTGNVSPLSASTQQPST